MAEPTAEDRRAAANAGFFGHLAGYASALAAYLSARLRLAGLEAKEAAVHYVILLALLIAGLVVAVFGYLFLWMALIFFIAWLFPAPATVWIASIAAALIHFGGAVACVLIAKSKFSQPMFTATIEEFHKDQQWLTTPTARRS